MAHSIVHDPGAFSIPDSHRRTVQGFVMLALGAMGIAVIHGFAQALNYAGINILTWFPGLHNYYQGLTVHGVLNALVLTFGFTNGFLGLTTMRGLGRPLHGGLFRASLYVFAAGIALAGWAMLTGRASVLFTFYPPLQGHWTYYLGLALLVVSTWLVSLAIFRALAAWRRENPGERVPLLAFVGVTTYAMWDLASLGIAVSVVGFLLPWSLGWIAGSDPLFARTLFWYSGHAIVYFWLLPAYVYWYLFVPHHAAGRLFSDPVTRVVFLLFLMLSIPTGFHHQYADPGIPEGMKFGHAILTFGVFYPSLITAFSVVAALEMGGRARGGTGLLGWFFKLDWGNPTLVACVLAMLVFALGGITGLINASFVVNQVVHNTAWIPGHFHMTVGTAVALTFMGIAYWLVPWLYGRALWGRRLAVLQGWLYFVGVLVFARGMISGGLEGMPRRTFMYGAPYSKPSWELAGILTGIGGTIMFVSVAIFGLVLAGTLTVGRREPRGDLPISETIIGPARSGWETRLDRFWIWVVATVILILIAYGPFLLGYLPPRLISPGFKLF